jgi:hypothetical protein
MFPVPLHLCFDHYHMKVFICFTMSCNIIFLWWSKSNGLEGYATLTCSRLWSDRSPSHQFIKLYTQRVFIRHIQSRQSRDAFARFYRPVPSLPSQMNDVCLICEWCACNSSRSSIPSSLISFIALRGFPGNITRPLLQRAIR